jgi:hypothetical protein
MRARRRWLAALVITVSLLVPLTVFGGTGLARGFSALAQYGHGPGSAQYQYGGKVTICHATHSKTNPFVTIVVSAQGAANHLKHHAGDRRGACPTNQQSSRSGDHGKGKNNDADDDQGKGKGHDKNKNDNANSQSNQGGDHGNSGNNGKGHGK